MSLRSKIVLVLIPVVAGYALVDHGVQRSILRPSFDALERDHALRDMDRTVLAIADEVATLAERAASWAEREDIARYAAGQAPSYPDAALGELVFANERLHLCYVLDPAGEVLWGEARHPTNGERLRLRDFPSGRMAPTHRLVSAERPRLPVSGLWNTDAGPLLVAAHPILAHGAAESVAGRLILGRFLMGDTMKRIAHRTQVPFDFWPLDGSLLPDEVAPVLDQVTASAHAVARALDKNYLHVYATLPDARHQPALLVRAKIDRAISSKGASAVNYALVSTLAAGLLMVFVLLRLLQRVVLRPLAQLTDQAVEIGRRDDSSLRLKLERDDEIGTLSNEFDTMLGRLEESRALVITAARSAGMSEIATGILHNVGNVLNSVCVSTGMIDDKLRRSRLGHLEKLVGLLQQHQHNLPAFINDDPKGKQLVPFVAALTRQLGDERSALQAELHHLVEAVEHIRELVSSQQAYATGSKLLEPTDVGTQVDAALRLCDKAGGPVAGVRVDRDIADVPRLALDKHKLVEILVNLIQNSRQSLAEAGRADGVLRVDARYDDGILTVRVVDNGVGIDEANLARVFNHGFTTRKSGHGFGLHASANAAVEMGGRLSAHSEGPGKGAMFTLTVPVAVPAAMATHALAS